MKKTVLTISIFISMISIATDYFAIVKKEENFNVSEIPLWENISPTYTNWVNTNIINNCNIWQPIINQQKSNFVQSTKCDVTQERIKNNLQKHIIDGTIKTVSQEVENKIINQTSFRDITVSNESELIEKDNYNCEIWSPQSSDKYYNLPLEQERNCDIDKMIKWNYTLNNLNIKNWEEKYTEKDSLEIKTIAGTHLESSCKDILNFDSSSTTGIYKLSNGGQNYDAYCDMETNGGGWTLLMMTREGTGLYGSSSNSAVVHTVIKSPNYDNWTEQPYNSNILDINTKSNVITEVIDKIPFNEILFQCHGERCLEKSDTESVYKDVTKSLFASKNGQLERETTTAFPFNTISMYYEGGNHSGTLVPTNKINFNPQCSPDTFRPNNYYACVQIGLVGVDYYSFQNAVGYGVKGFENYSETNEMNVMLGGMHHRGFNVWESNVFIR